MPYNIKNKAIFFATLSTLTVVCILIFLNINTTPGSSPEWIYTVKWINIITIPALVIIAIFIFGLGLIKFIRSKYSKALLAICSLLSIILFIIPFFMSNFMYMAWPYQYFLSACWAGALFFTGLSFFIAATKAASGYTSIFCFLGSLAISLCITELVLLCTRQPLDGVADLSAQSRYSQTGKGRPHYANWHEWQCGLMPSTPGNPNSAYHRLALFDHDFFDVKYSYNSNGWRLLPSASATAQNDLILFGCSFTFGFGLEDEETWAWKLAKQLGPDWKLENYSANGYSASQMLCMLEHKLIVPPAGKNRFALFLGLDNHIRRNEFFPATPHYEIAPSGEVVAGGKAGHTWIFDLPNTFNGSQLARELNPVIAGMITKRRQIDTDIYLAIISKAAQILKRDYNTQLIMLLWPDLENLQEKIEAAGIPVLLVRSMLTDWDNSDDPGSMYRINQRHEFHPNRKAATELAAGLAAYFQGRINDIPIGAK